MKKQTFNKYVERIAEMALAYKLGRFSADALVSNLKIIVRHFEENRLTLEERENIYTKDHFEKEYVAGSPYDGLKGKDDAPDEEKHNELDGYKISKYIN